MKWKASDYKYPLQHWTPPELLYPSEPSEKEVLHALKSAFQPLPPYASLENQAREQNTLVTLDISLPDGQIAFLENTAEQCTSPQTKHSQAGMQGAKHWVQRVDTPEGVFRRLTDGYGISLMFGERCHQYIRNSNNWRGISGCLLDVDLFEDDKTPEAPPPVYSMQELFDRYPLLPQICRFILPSASSLYEGRPFKARGVLLFPEPVTDQRVYRAFGDLLLSELNCIPANVTKNPVAVGFGNTHNAKDTVFNDATDSAWIDGALEQAKSTVLSTAKQRKRDQKQKAKFNEHYRQQRTGSGEGENISEFIAKCDPVAEMIRAGMLTPGRGNEYRWHESEHDRSCEIFGHGVIHIFSHSMSAASPAAELEPVNAHRFYLYQLTGLDLAKDSDKAKCREYLFDRGYGCDPKAFAKKQHKGGIRKPVKLFKSRFQGMLETLDLARDFLKEVFTAGARFFAIRTDTGTGKTENAITYALTKDVAIPTQSAKLRDEIVSRASKAEIFAWGYRGIRDTDDSNGYLPCIQSERFEVMRDKGFNPYKWVCDTCTVQSECKERGYLSQPERARQSQLVALPFPTAFLDPRLRNWATLYLPRGKDALILHDDLPLSSLFYECRLSAKRLRQIYEQWKGTKAAEWAEACLQAFSLRDFQLLQKIICQLSDTEYSVVTEALTHCIDPLSGAIVSPDEYLASPSVNFGTPDACTQLPQVDPQGADIATLLGAFFTRYSRLIDAPFYYETAKECFVFYMPPKPIQSKRKTLRCGFASATLEKKLITHIFPDIEFYDAAATQWVEGSNFFQLRTNRNPRATVMTFREKYTADGKNVKEFDGLSPAGEYYWNLVIDFIKANPNERHAVLSYKSVIEEKQAELDALGIVSGWFGNIAGLDETFEGVKHFHILFCPYVDPGGVDLLVKQIFGNDDEPINRDADGKLPRNDDGTYTDERTQLCHDALVTAELLQVIGRARLNLYPNSVYLWSSLFVDSVSNRDAAVLFDEVDWQQAGNDTAKLHGIVAQREKQEQATEQAIDEGDVQGVKDTKGVSQSQAYELTKPARQQSKTERNREIYRRYTAGESKASIARDLKIHRNTIDNVLEKYKF